MGSVTMVMDQAAHGFLLRSQLSETAETLHGLPEQLLGLRDMRDDDPARPLRMDDVRNALDAAIGELTALRTLLDADAAMRVARERQTAGDPEAS